MYLDIPAFNKTAAVSERDLATRDNPPEGVDWAGRICYPVPGQNFYFVNQQQAKITADDLYNRGFPDSDCCVNTGPYACARVACERCVAITMCNDVRLPSYA